MSSEHTESVAGFEIGETIPVREQPGDSPNLERVDEAVETVADAEGELCIVLRNVGASPWLRPTPYENNRGVLVRMWSCISVYPKAAPGNTLLFGHRVPVWPDEYDDYNVRMFTKEWVRAELRKGTHFEVRPAEESPFCTDWYDWNWENRERPGNDDAEYDATPERCSECGTTVRVGVIDGDYGLFCECTRADGRPFKSVRGYPWPDRWDTDSRGETR